MRNRPSWGLAAAGCPSSQQTAGSSQQAAGSYQTCCPSYNLNRHDYDLCEADFNKLPPAEQAKFVKIDFPQS